MNASLARASSIGIHEKIGSWDDPSGTPCEMRCLPARPRRRVVCPCLHWGVALCAHVFSGSHICISHVYIMGGIRHGFICIVVSV